MKKKVNFKIITSFTEEIDNENKWTMGYKCNMEELIKKYIEYYKEEVKLDCYNFLSNLNKPVITVEAKEAKLVINNCPKCNSDDLRISTKVDGLNMRCIYCDFGITEEVDTDTLISIWNKINLDKERR